MLIKEIATSFTDAVFPLLCVVCDREGALVCDTCSSAVRPPFRQACPLCQRTTPYGASCARHTKGALDGVVAIASYADVRIKSLIRLWKYQFVRAAEPYIEREIVRVVREFSPLFPFDEIAIVPVPLHPRRARERGFDQAVVVARLFGCATGFFVREDILRRTRYTRRHQADIEDDAKRRTQIVTDHFHTNTNGVQLPLTIVLVDDVYTTGATMQSAAAALKAAGVQTVWGFVLARGR